MAEELVQSTCVRALERSAQFTPGTRIDRWLFSILHSIWVSDLRTRKVRQGQGFVDPDALLSADNHATSDDNRHFQRIMQQVNTLPEAQRNALFLVYVEGLTYYVEGLTYKEAAETLAVPIGTIMSRLAAARATLVRQPTTSPAPQEKRR
jgi:RNA polymerase sigma-70 factor (ECF subfamily)